MTEDNRFRDLRLRQRGLLADLGTAALRGTQLDDLLQEGCRFVAEGVGVRFCKVLELVDNDERLLVRSGVGWREGVVGNVKLDADDGSPAGHALRTGAPVISNNLAAEPRFRTPLLLIEHGVERAMNVIIRGDGEPFGVLEVDSPRPGSFSEEDISFMQASANLLGVAIERGRREAELRREIEKHEILRREADHRIKNSLQLIASLLTLQRSRLKHPPAIAALDDAIARVWAVAETHRQLHQSLDLRTISLRRMTADLCAHVGQLSTTVTIQCSSEAGIQLEAERAIPLGLIISELLTNAIRHAYPNGRRGTVHLRAGSVEGHLEIAISDQGSGITDQGVRNESSLGTTIVSTLARQIGAELHTNSTLGQGTQVTVRLPFRAG